MARSTPRICARQRRRITSFFRARDEALVPQFTFHGFRYMEITGLKSALRAQVRHSAGVPHGCAVHGEADDGQRDDQQAVEQYSLGAAVEFCRRAHGLPAARRAAGMDGGCAGVLAGGDLQHGPGGFFAQVCGGYARDAGRHAVLRHLSPRGRHSKSPGVAAAWSDAGVIIPWTSWLQTGDTSVIDENWPAMRKYLDAIDARESRWNLGQRFGDSLRRLAFARRTNASRI